MILDIGTGDGRAVLARAARAQAADLVIGIDASAAAMAESSRRAARDPGLVNALFFAAGVEALPGTPLAGAADLVTVTLPWGSLLRGVLGLDPAALAGLAAASAPGGLLAVLVSVVPSDGVAGMPCLEADDEPRIRSAWAAAGLCLDTMRPATRDQLVASASTWARRLRSGAGADRPVWSLVGHRLRRSPISPARPSARSGPGSGPSE